ncbi:MAG: sulfite exporter TauE/SafE family protein [Clostridia bacterium]|nr:sulfite exporter TauE/SafE family protein [Clostridia bacterium]
MEILKLCLFGALGGVLGGMGMGGGTVLIPLLTIFLSWEQKTAQAVNLIAFIPMAIVALVVHIKNKLIKKDNILFMIIPACVMGIAGAVLISFIKSEVLSKIFGWFLVALAVLQFFWGNKGQKQG